MKGNAVVSLGAARILICGFGGLAIAWALFTFPIFWQQSAIEQIEKHIIAGDSFKSDALKPLTPVLSALGQEKWGRPTALGGAAVIKLRLLEQAFVGSNQNALDRLMKETGETIRTSLANSPSDPFLWLVLFWLENTKNGFNRAHLKYLQMSYFLGPNEGWISVKRNRFALAIFSALPSDIAEDAVSEFARLVDSGFIAESADILVGPAWSIRDTLLPRLKDVDEVSRQAFAKAV
ncbi:MAG TPA: hypothetical protein VIK28_09220 [Sedimentisphaerales bacterium]